MHNVNVEALEQTVAKAKEDHSAVKQRVSFDGEWQTEEGRPQFRAGIPVPNGDPVIFEADFPPPMGGTGSAPTRSPSPARASSCAPCAPVRRPRSTRAGPSASPRTLR